MAIRPIYGANVGQIKSMIRNSEVWLEIIRKDRKERIHFENIAGSLATRDHAAVKEFAATIQLLVRESEKVVNAFELAKLVEAELACLLEHMFEATGYRREVYERMLA